MERTSKTWPVDIGALKAACQHRLPELVYHLYPSRPIVPYRNGFRVGNKGSIDIRGDGIFYDLEAGKGGDIIKLVAHALQTDFKGAVIFCNGFLGTPPQVARFSQSAQSGFKSIKTKPRDSETRIAKAKSIWGEGITIAGTLAELYLSLRGITLSPPATLRFHSALWNHSTQEKHPALLACVQSPDGDLCGVQAVYLDASGRKISGDGVLAKISYGCLSGGAVRLSTLSEPLILCEGVEDGLSILQAMPDTCVWASCGTSGMVNAVLPDSIHEVIIASDADDAGQKAANTLAARLKKEGRVARIATPAHSKDFNELLVQGNIACLTK